MKFSGVLSYCIWCSVYMEGVGQDLANCSVEGSSSFRSRRLCSSGKTGSLFSRVWLSLTETFSVYMEGVGQGLPNCSVEGSCSFRSRRLCSSGKAGSLFSRVWLSHTETVLLFWMNVLRPQHAGLAFWKFLLHFLSILNCRDPNGLVQVALRCSSLPAGCLG